MARVVRSPKTVWHPLSLQQLAPKQFVFVVNGILSGQYSLLTESLQGATTSPELREASDTDNR